VPRLVLRAGQIAKPLQVRAHGVRALAPHLGIAWIAQDREPRVQSGQRQHGVTHIGGQPEGGQRLAGHLAVERHQTADRAQAQDADGRQHHDDE
jgi:hypothetical protein